MRSTAFKEIHDEFMAFAKEQGFWTPVLEETNREIVDYLDAFADAHGIEALFSPRSVNKV
jgi:hypothetical protein